MFSGLMKHSVGAGATLALLLTVAPLAAQSPTPDATGRARLEAELARVDARIEVLSQKVQARSQALEQRLESESLERQVRQIGPFRLEGTKGMLDEAAPALAREWRSFVEQLGDLSFLPAMRIELFPSHRVYESDLRPGVNHRRLPWSELYPSTSRVVTSAREMVRDALPPRLTSWTQGSALTRRADPRLGYEALLTTTRWQGIACAQQSDLDACMRFLFVDYDGDVETSRSAVDGWHTDFRDFSLAASRTPGYSNNPAADVCRPPGFNRSACVDYLAQPRFIMNVVPSNSSTRGALMQRALDLDPDGRGLARAAVLPANASVAEQLEAISRVPIRELVRQWREGLSVSGQMVELDGGGPGPFTLLWAGAFALFSLRSTRWRLG